MGIKQMERPPRLLSTHSALEESLTLRQICAGKQWRTWPSLKPQPKWKKKHIMEFSWVCPVSPVLHPQSQQEKYSSRQAQSPKDFYLTSLHTRGQAKGSPRDSPLCPVPCTHRPSQGAGSVLEELAQFQVSLFTFMLLFAFLHSLGFPPTLWIGSKWLM